MEEKVNLETHVTKKGRLWTVFCLLVIGLSIGWMMGLSVSPTAQTVLSSLLVIVSGLAGLLAGLPSSEIAKSSMSLNRYRVNPAPVMFLIIGIVIGSSVGVYARTNLWLGSNIQRLSQKLSEETGAKQEDLAKLLLKKFYFSSDEVKNPGVLPNLFADETPENECKKLVSLAKLNDGGKMLRTQLLKSSDPKVLFVAEKITDMETLKIFAEDILCVK